MGYREAERLQDRIQLDHRIKLFARDGPPDGTTGIRAIGTVEIVWAAKIGASEFRLGRAQNFIIDLDRLVIRWAEPWASLDAGEIEISLDLEATGGDTVYSKAEIGRRRFIRLELD